MRSRIGFLLAILLGVALVLSGWGLPPAAAQETEPDVALNLEGQWRFTVGDDLAWAQPDFDDSGWGTITVPGDGEPFDDYDGFGWYRLTFDLPANADGTNLIASLGFLDDVDEAYLNGTLIGASGTMPPQARSKWFERRLYPVPADVARFGGSNTLGALSYAGPGLRTPLAQADEMSGAELRRFDFYFDACEFDEYRFDDAARRMDAILTSKEVPHTWAVRPEGRHNDACWMPHLQDSFAMHSAHVRAAGLQEDWVAPVASAALDQRQRVVLSATDAGTGVDRIEYRIT